MVQLYIELTFYLPCIDFHMAEDQASQRQI
jgi:hypothetical protein